MASRKCWSYTMLHFSTWLRMASRYLVCDTFLVLGSCPLAVHSAAMSPPLYISKGCEWICSFDASISAVRRFCSEILVTESVETGSWKLLWEEIYGLKAKPSCSHLCSETLFINWKHHDILDYGERCHRYATLSVPAGVSHILWLFLQIDVLIKGFLVENIINLTIWCFKKSIMDRRHPS